MTTREASYAIAGMALASLGFALYLHSNHAGFVEFLLAVVAAFVFSIEGWEVEPHE